MKRYQRSGIIEPLRKLCRAIDFLSLLLTFRIQRRLPPIAELRKMTFLEVGPGPMRLAALKRKLFRHVYFFDMADFGIPDPGLNIIDIEQCADSRSLMANLPEISPDDGVFVFADHCLEHISTEVLVRFLSSIPENGFAACFRVPNIFSPTGSGSFRGDPTHRTAFDAEFRRRIETFGFTISPWIRWYRPLLASRVLLRGGLPMNHAEEIAISISRHNELS